MFMYFVQSYVRNSIETININTNSNVVVIFAVTVVQTLLGASVYIQHSVRHLCIYVS
jgi:hypothetical protein